MVVLGSSLRTGDLVIIFMGKDVPEDALENEVEARGASVEER